VRHDSRATRGFRRIGLVAALVVAAGVGGQTQRGALTATKVPTTIVTGALKDSTVYTLVKPENWNGTVFVDLDSTALNSDASNWLYARGIARAGTTRVQIGSLVNQAADNLVETLDVFTARFGKPSRALISGSSLGGQVAAVTAFRHADRFAGAVAFCGGLMGWAPYLNTNLDAAFTARTLLAPAANMPLVHIPKEDAALTEQWQTLLKTAQGTPQGRARIMLAVLLGQAPIWTTRDMAEPAAGDVKGRQEAAFNTLLDFSRQFTALRRRLEEPAGGATSWNAGVSYSGVYRNRVSAADRQTLEALYREAGLSIETDLRALDAAPRIPAEAGPVAFVRQLYPFDGNIRIPVFTMSNTGDPYVWSSIDSGYAAAVQRAGKSDLLRMTYVRSAGHCAFSNAEQIASFQVLLERLDSGRWPETSPSAMNARAAAANLGAARFWNYTPPATDRASLVP
jgi:pimeloyl-ACP methyl ester carboxylesterase